MIATSVEPRDALYRPERLAACCSCCVERSLEYVSVNVRKLILRQHHFRDTWELETSELKHGHRNTSFDLSLRRGGSYCASQNVGPKIKAP